MEDAKIWFTHLWANETVRYRWNNNPANSFKAKQASLFHKHKPVISYGFDPINHELDEPMHNGTVSMWEMCAGLLGNVHFTLPLVRNSGGQYVPTTLGSSSSTSYSPYGASTTPNITALENFISQITSDAFHISPFYRHYGMQHLASNSAGCGDYAASFNNPVPNGSTYRFAHSMEPGKVIFCMLHFDMLHFANIFLIGTRTRIIVPLDPGVQFIAHYIKERHPSWHAWECCEGLMLLWVQV